MTGHDFATLIADGEFQPWSAPGVVFAKRDIYVTERVAEILNRRWNAPIGDTQANADDRRNEVLAIMATWQRGDGIIADTQLKPLTPPPVCDGVWQFRATRHQPQARVIGLIPSRNIFVATGIYPRSYLGQKGSPEWNLAISFAATRAHRWFSTNPLVTWRGGRFAQTDMHQVCDDF